MLLFCVNHVCDPAGIQTQDLQNRNLTLYSAKLRDQKIMHTRAGIGVRCERNASLLAGCKASAAHFRTTLQRYAKYSAHKTSTLFF